MKTHWLLLMPGLMMVSLLASGSGGTAAERASSTPAATLDSDTHLAGWWKFDETSGRSAADSSKHGRAGALEGNLAFDTHSASGRLDAALRFDGNNDCVRIAGFKGVTGAAPRTITAWVKTSQRSGEIVSWGEDGPGKMWNLCFIRGRVGVTPKGGYFYMKEGVSDDAWHHVAAVVTEASPPNLHDHVTLFRDGEVAIIDDIGLLDLWPIETGDKLDVTIGRRFKGLIDDVRVYDRTLSEDEIKALFNQAGNQPSTKP